MSKFKTFVAIRNSDFGNKGPYLAVEPAEAVKLLYYRLGLDRVDVMIVTEKLVSEDWRKQEKNPTEQARLFKTLALADGATPEAIRLLKGLVPITKKEENIMAEKLKAKATGDKEGLKTAAKKAPVARGAAAGEQPKKRGNPEALAKARAAKGPDTRKIKVLKKAHGARAGSSRATMLDTIYKAKTVEEAKTAGVTGSQVSWAAKEGYISLS